MHDQWLTVRDVAQALQVTEKTVRRWIAAQRLQATKVSDRGGWRIHPADLEQLMRRSSGTTER